MSIESKPAPRVKLARSIRVMFAPFEGNPGVVRITVGKEATDYMVQAIPADFGTAFRLVKLGQDAGDEYAVNLNGERSSCECKGHLRWHHCKHVEGLQALINAGQLTHPNQVMVAWDAVDAVDAVA